MENSPVVAIPHWKKKPLQDAPFIHLLRRPRELPVFKDEERGIYASWICKAYIYRRGLCVKAGLRCRLKVQYASLCVESRIPCTSVKVPLVTVGYIESAGNMVDIRGCRFTLRVCGFEEPIAGVRDWLRFLVIRQRVPHSLLGLPFEWQNRPSKNAEQPALATCCLKACFCENEDEMREPAYRPALQPKNSLPQLQTLQPLEPLLEEEYEDPQYCTIGTPR